MSGSVSDVLLAKILTELKSLSRLATFSIIPFDSAVLESEVYKVEKDSNKLKWERVLTGGTCFDSITRYVNENQEYDALIIASDLEASMPGACRVRRLWLTDEQHEASSYMDPRHHNERVIAVR